MRVLDGNWDVERTIGPILEFPQDEAERDLTYSNSQPPRVRNTVARWLRNGEELKEPVSNVLTLLPCQPPCRRAVNGHGVVGAPLCVGLLRWEKSQKRMR